MITHYVPFVVLIILITIPFGCKWYLKCPNVITIPTFTFPTQTNNVNTFAFLNML